MPEVDLIKMSEIIKNKEKLRDKLLGRKSMIIEELGNLGFNSKTEANTALTIKKKEVEKMEAHYAKGKSAFKKKYQNLLEND